MKILGYEYTLVIDGSTDDMGAMGRFLVKPQRIQIANDLVRQQVESTIIHEALEALNFHLELEIKHTTIAALEAGLYQFLVDNGVDLSPLTGSVTNA